MNNAQFRELVSSDRSKLSRQDVGSSALVPRSLGSRARPARSMASRSMAMSYSGHNPDRQAADQSRQGDGEPAQKKFKSSAAPKGTKLAAGYHDRTKLREDGYTEETSKEKKLKDLEKMLKDEKIDRATFERLRDQMGIGGDLSTTHLVKGLDFKLLERMRKGEDIDNSPLQDKDEVKVDVDDELDNVLQAEVTVLPSGKINSAEEQEQEQEQEKEQASAQPQILSREEVIRRLKESRRTKPYNEEQKNQIAPQQSLGHQFKKLPAAEKPGKKKFVEIVNGRRREVLILTKKDGSTKRKTRWIDSEDVASNENATPLGMEVPAEFAAKQKALLEQETAAEEDDDDIFVGVADYDPLHDLDTDSESESKSKSESESESKSKSKSKSKKDATTVKEANESTDDGVEAKSKPRDYFGDKNKSEEEKGQFSSIKDDAKLMAALKRAASLRRLEEEDSEHPASEADASSLRKGDQEDRGRKFLARLKEQDRQDAEDLDLGFGESRFADDDDDEQGPIYEGDEGGGGKKSRKRGPKKRKGDKNNVSDVMSVLENKRK